MHPFLIEVEVFREILFLPLRLTDIGNTQAWLQGYGGEFAKHWKPSDTIAPQSGAYEPSNIKGGSEDEASFQKRWRYAEHAYFHPSVQKFLYNDDSCKHYELYNPIETMRVDGKYGLTSPQGDSFSIELNVDACRLTVVPEPGLAILSLEVYATSGAKVQRYKSESPAKRLATKLCLADALALHDSLRRIYPPYFWMVPKDEDKLPTYDTSLFPSEIKIEFQKDKTDTCKDSLSVLIDQLKPGVAMPYAPWWRDLLKPLLDHGNFVQVVDDRMPSMVFLGLKKPELIDQNELIRLCFADHPDNNPPYDSNFMKNFMKDHAYTRFKHIGTTYFNSSYSFVCVAEVDQTWDKGSFARDVLQEHFRRHYAKMFFIVQMQKAALLAFSAWLSNAVAEKSNGTAYIEKIRQVREGLVTFTHRFWFSNVSNQEQARELFTQMQKHSGNPELFAEVQAESSAARDELAIRAAESQAESALMFNVLISVATVFGLPLAYFGTNHADAFKPLFYPMMTAASLLAGLCIYYLSNHQSKSGMRPEATQAAGYIALVCLFAAAFFLASAFGK